MLKPLDPPKTPLGQAASKVSIADLWTSVLGTRPLTVRYKRIQDEVEDKQERWFRSH